MPPAADPYLAGIIPLEQYPPMRHHLGWLWLAAACFVMALTIGLAARWACRRLDAVGQPPSGLVDAVRARALADLDTIEQQVNDGTTSQAEAHRRLGQVLRRCIGTLEANNVDFEGLAEIEQHATEDERLQPLVEVLRASHGPAFDPLCTGDALGRVREAREVVQSW